jgi:MurNAc alpha-1-phosphate uridylyltransferase
MTKTYPVAILAGGLATRLRPITEKIPKALLPIHGEPFIYHQLRLLKKQGIDEVVICVGYLGEMIEDYVGKGGSFGLNVQYVFDGNILLGTGGALKKALPLLGDRFFVLYGDSYLPCNFLAIQEAYKRSQKQALMTLYYNQGAWDSSNVVYKDGAILCYDKKNRNDRMHHIDYGLGVFNKEVFTSTPEGEPCDLADIYQVLLQKEQLAAYEVPERFYEIGSLAGIKEFTQYILQEAMQ